MTFPSGFLSPISLTTAALTLGSAFVAARRSSMNTRAASTGRSRRSSSPDRSAARRPTPSCSSTARTCRNGTAATSGKSKTGTPSPARRASRPKQVSAIASCTSNGRRRRKSSGEGQGRGNSGVYLMERYEVQILDSYQNKTYFDGQAAAIYKQHPPLVNACRKPGEWQTYDIIFTAPRSTTHGKLVKPAYVTDPAQWRASSRTISSLLGATFYDRPPAYEAHPAKAPIHIQFHGNPVRFRNIWIREL